MVEAYESISGYGDDKPALDLASAALMKALGEDTDTEDD